MKYIYLTNGCMKPYCKEVKCEICKYENIRIQFFKLSIKIPRFVLKIIYHYMEKTKKYNKWEEK